MSGPKPTRDQGDLAAMLETLLDKGVVVNADIAVTVGETELLNVHVRAAVASFETAAAYGLEFPGGTDMERVRAAAGVDPSEPRPVDRVDERPPVSAQSVAKQGDAAPADEPREMDRESPAAEERDTETEQAVEGDRARDTATERTEETDAGDDVEGS